MDEGSDRRRTSLDRATATRAGLAVGLIVIVAGVLAPSLLRTPPPDPSPSHPVAIASPDGSLEPSAPAPSATPDPWSDLDVPAFTALAELIPLDTDRLGVAPDTAFRLRSLTDTPATELATGLRAEPRVEFTIEPGETDDVATVHAAAPLDRGERYRFRLTGVDGSLIGSWAFRTRAPLHVVSTIPGDLATGVPPNTGIEVTFDQDGLTSLPEHFSIEPPVAGRFEPHGRTWAFVPDKPLTPAVIYTVTVNDGVGLEGSEEILETGVTFRFETGLPEQRPPTLVFGRSVVEVRPNRAPDIEVWIDDDDEGGRVRRGDTFFVVAHRLPTFRSVIDAATALAGADGWAVASPSAIVDTTSLTRVARVKSTIAELESGMVLRIPARLDAGFYVLTIEQPGSPAQALLQVTNLSAYALTATEDMVVWVNDMATTDPIAGAAVATAGGRELGATNADGLLRIATPEMLLDPAEGVVVDEDGDVLSRAARILTVQAPDGRRMVLPLGMRGGWQWWSYEGGWWGPSGHQDWWVAFFSDRMGYRQTDTVHLSGTVRARGDRSVPSTVEIRLRSQEDPGETPILRVTAKPSARGVFTADLRLDDLPRASYGIDLYVGTEQVSSVWIEVTEIRKPAYRIDVDTDRRVYLVGDDVHASGAASFYDGSSVPGMDLRFRGMDQEVVATTGATGQASTTLDAAFEGRPFGWEYEYVGVAPANPEEGQIEGDRWLLVFPSRVWLEANGAIRDGKIVVTGALNEVDFAGLETAVSAGADFDPATGDRIAGGSVRAVVIHNIPTKKQIGTTYDFIEKRVVPIYQYGARHEQIASEILTTNADGTFRLSMPAPVPGHDYTINLSTTDEAGLRFAASVSAHRARTYAEPSYMRQPYLEVLGQCGTIGSVEAGIDERVELTLHDADGTVASGGNLLFLVGSRGSLETTVQDAATFARTMRDADLPSFTVRVVWLNGGNYFVADADVHVDPDEKAITVTLQPDKARYRPGEDVRVQITTTDAKGRPIATDVIVQGIDEKLYTLGLGSWIDPLAELMAPTSPEFRDSYRSHAVPIEAWGGGCGDTGGGRDDFRDTVTFQRVTTDASGHGVARFDLSDDLTSWRITAAAYSGRLDAGVATVQIPVGLPFFVESVLAPEYLVGDQAMLLVRGYGDALSAGEDVRFTVSSATLGLEPTTVHAPAFEAGRVALPAMTPGDHSVRIEAEFRDGETIRRDVLIRTFHVVSSRLRSISTTFEPLGPSYSVEGGDGLTRFVITDAGRGRLLALVDRLAAVDSSRFDRQAAAEVARTILIEDYGVPATSLRETGFDSSRFHREGIALLPYASADLALTAKAALVVPDLLAAEQIRDYLREWAYGEQDTEDPPRERRIVALAGLAGLGFDVAADLEAFDPGELTVMERLWLALAYAALGDDPTATAIERGVLLDFGQRLGPWVRLLGPTAVQSEEASALLLLLASRLGDPIHHDVARYLDDNPSSEHVFPLEQIGYVQASLERLPRTPARFAWTLDGERHEAALEPGGSFVLVLTRSQWTGLRLERLEGEVGVATTRESSDFQLPSNPKLSITRTVTPSGTAPSTGLVRVRIDVTFGSQLPEDCYRLTDLVPSGLAPIGQTPAWGDDEDRSGRSPWQVDGQRVTWCAAPSDPRHVYEYSARVVTPGTYRWEPALLEWELAPSLGTATEESTYVIR